MEDDKKHDAPANGGSAEKSHGSISPPREGQHRRKRKRVHFFADMEVEFGGKPEPSSVATYEENEPGLSSVETIQQRHSRLQREKDERRAAKRRKRDQMTEEQDLEQALAELAFMPTFLSNLRSD